MYVQAVKHSGKWRIALRRWWRPKAYLKELDDCAMDFGHVCWDIVEYNDLYEAEVEAENHAKRNNAKYIRSAYWEEGREEEWSSFQKWKEGSDCDCSNCKSIYRQTGPDVCRR